MHIRPKGHYNEHGYASGYSAPATGDFATSVQLASNETSEALGTGGYPLPRYADGGYATGAFSGRSIGVVLISLPSREMTE